MEGHTDFVAEILKNDVKSAKMMTTEGTRLIEGILVGRHFSEAPIITSRICGICPVVHKLSSIKAIENAFGIKPTIQTIKLRKVMELAQIVHSHALHLFFLSMPDFFDIEDDLKFLSDHSKETASAIKVREWALKIIEVIGGRAVHPIACEVGGFKVLPKKIELDNLVAQNENIMKEALKLVNMVIKIRYPKFKRSTRFISLTSDKEYAIYEGDLAISSDENKKYKIVKASDFTKNIEEIEEPYRAAKSATLDGEPFMVGALARINNNHAKLNPMAKGILKGLDWKFPQLNSFENITAQAIEIVHAIEEIVKILRSLKTIELEESLGKKLNVLASANPKGRLVKGVDAIEAPRGTLYHHYGIDKNGFIVECNIITPTVSFLKNLEEDIKLYLPNVLKLSDRQRTRKIRALIRAYDPCIACATH